MLPEVGVGRNVQDTTEAQDTVALSEHTRSLPHMVVLTILSTASAGSLTSGIGFSVTLILPTPSSTSAFIIAV